MGRTRWELVYDQINGAYMPGEHMGIRDESGMDGLLGAVVEQIYGARNRLCERTGISPDKDPDLEEIVSGFEQLCRICGMLMYEYGQKDGAESVEKQSRPG